EQELDEVDADVGRVLGARPRVTATELRGGVTLATRDLGEGEPAGVLAEALLVLRQALHDAGLPVAGELHRDLAVREEAGGRLGRALRLGALEARVERLLVDELLQALTGPQPARVGEVELLRGRLERSLRALAQTEVVPVVRSRPAGARADRDGLDARGLERVHGRVQVVHR